MLIGFHVSIAGGFCRAVTRAEGLGCTTFQIFSHSPRMWRFSPIPREEADAFREARAASGISPVFVHTSYLINLASEDIALYERSVEALREELLRADALGAEYVVTHVGTAHGDREAAVRRVAAGIREAHRGGEGFRVKLLLENTACERGDMGCAFGEIARMMELSGVDGIGAAVDTCHSFGAGYDIKTPKGLEDTVKLIDKAFGLDRLKLVHLNDSMHPLGSHRDRHKDIGTGYIGKAAIGRIINHPRLRDLPFVMETPRRTPEDDVRNMKVARGLKRG